MEQSEEFWEFRYTVPSPAGNVLVKLTAAEAEHLLLDCARSFGLLTRLLEEHPEVRPEFTVEEALEILVDTVPFKRWLGE